MAVQLKSSTGISSVDPIIIIIIYVEKLDGKAIVECALS